MKTSLNLYLLPLWLSVPLAAPWAQGAQGGLNTYVAVDLVGDSKLNRDSSAKDKLELRGAELSFSAPVDHLFDGKLSLAAHAEEGELVFEVHEAVISSSRLIPRSRLKVGQYFLGVGRLNQVHQHDWAFTSSPIVHSFVFNDDEGALDTGVEYSWLAPTETYFDLTVGVSNGFTYGHSHNEGEKPKTPNQYLRLVSYFSLGAFQVQPGVSLLRRQDSNDNKTQLVGLDWKAKVKEGRRVIHLWQHETWYRSLKPSAGAEEKHLGLYSFYQYGFTNTLMMGLRLDYLSNLELKDSFGKDLENHRAGYEFGVTYAASEFSKFRLAYQAEQDHLDGRDDVDQQSLWFQTTFILGAHPAHDF